MESEEILENMPEIEEMKETKEEQMMEGICPSLVDCFADRRF